MRADALTAEARDTLLLQLHDMSMDRDPDTAREGRLLKVVAPALLDYMLDERKRGTPPAEAIETLCQGVSKAFLGAAGLAPTASHVSADEALATLVEAFKEVLDDNTESLRHFRRTDGPRALAELIVEIMEKVQASAGD